MVSGYVYTIYKYFHVFGYVTHCVYMIIPYINHCYNYITHTCDNLLTPISHLINKEK